MTTAHSKNKVFFGYKKVFSNQKTNLIKELFNNASQNYDLMNDIMSLGIHRLWKKDLIDHLNLTKNCNILDLAGGTGDIAVGIKKKYLFPKVFVCDLSNNMILQGKINALNRGVYEGIHWITGDANNIPIKSNSMDNVTISFGLRNVSDIPLTLTECVRVLKPGGRFLCLEFTPEITDILKPFYNIYSFKIIPLLGKIFANNEPAYRYLVESIRNFPMPADLATIMEHTGLGTIRIKRYLGGIACLHSAWKI